MKDHPFFMAQESPRTRYAYSIRQRCCLITHISVSSNGTRGKSKSSPTTSATYPQTSGRASSMMRHPLFASNSLNLEHDNPSIDPLSLSSGLPHYETQHEVEDETNRILRILIMRGNSESDKQLMD